MSELRNSAKAAGYTVLISYDRFNTTFNMWLGQQFYTEQTTLSKHQEALNAQLLRGEIRNIKIQEI